MNWVPIKATLINVYIDEMITTTTRDNRSQYTLYTPRILYKYNTNGQEHTGRKVTWYDIYDDGFMLKLGLELKRKFAASEASKSPKRARTSRLFTCCSAQLVSGSNAVRCYA